MRNALKALRQKQEGFTLIEILVVIGLIAILAAIVIIAINPARQFAQGRNTTRHSNVLAILNAIGQRSADNKGIFAGPIPGTTQTCPALTAGTTYRIAKLAVPGPSDIDLSCLTPTYIPTAMPIDPSATGAHWNSATDYDTEYNVSLDSGGRYTVNAPGAEVGETISLTR